MVFFGRTTMFRFIANLVIKFVRKLRSRKIINLGSQVVIKHMTRVFLEILLNVKVND